MEKTVIGFIGGGNMASSLIGGLLANQHPAAAIHVSEPDGGRRDDLARRFPVHVHADNRKTVAAAQVLVLAVKPQKLEEVSRDLAEQVRQRRPLIISIAAGVRAADIARWLGDDALPLIRVMPNTPALIGAGATALYATAAVSHAQRETAATILSAVGIACWVEDEAALDAVTAISGSGPAYFFHLMEALQSAGEALGLDAHTARSLVLQTAFGAARMALESDEDPRRLRERVTSPGGTTERALGILQSQGFADAISRAAAGAAERSRELGDELGRRSN